MDQVARYRQIIQQVLEDYARVMSTGAPVRILPVCDTARDQYLLISLGRHNQRREHAIVFHAQFCDGKIRIEEDGTEDGIGNRLLTAGVADEDITLAWAAHDSAQDKQMLAA